MKEAELKSAVEEYLQYKQNAGELVYLRLNTGEFIELRGDTRRRVKGCPKGTADLLVLMGAGGFVGCLRVIFLELKSEKGRSSPEQAAFGKLVEMQGCEYHIVRSIEEMEEVLNGS